MATYEDCFRVPTFPHALCCGQVSDLLSFHHPRHECTSSGANRKGRRNSQRQVPLEATSCVVQELFGGIATLLRSVSNHSHTILNRVGNRASCRKKPGELIRQWFRPSLLPSFVTWNPPALLAGAIRVNCQYQTSGFGNLVRIDHSLSGHRGKGPV